MAHEELEPGRLVDRVELRVEAGKIAELRRATGTTADDGELAPLTYSVVTGHRRDQTAYVASLGLDIRRIVMGGVGWEYHRPLRAGDVLEATRRVESDRRREGSSGPMRIIGLATEFRDAVGQLVLVQRETLIERGAA